MVKETDRGLISGLMEINTLDNLKNRIERVMGLISGLVGIKVCWTI